MKSTYTFVLFIILVVLGQAQTSNKNAVSGFVKDNFGNPIEGATVSIPHQNIATSSDVDGYYKLISENVSEQAILQVTAVGYASEQRSLNGKYTQDFQLKEDRNAIQEVMVSGVAKSDNERKVAEIKRSGFNVSVIDMNVHANKTANINQILRTAPGVTFREDGGLGSNFVFRINGLDAKIYIDGVPMDNFGSSMSLNNIPVNLVDRIEIYKGVVPAFLGSDALGGAVNIITKQRSRHYLDLSYSHGSFNTHQAALVGMYTNPKNKLSVRTNAFYNYSDNNYTMYSEPKYGVVYEKTVDNRFVPIDEVKRFRDRYYSAMGQIEVGLRDKSWADQFFVGVTYSANNKQNQLGATISSVNGGDWRESQYVMPTISYKKQNFLMDRLFADIYASVSYDVATIRDTALYNYDWSGSWVANQNPSNTNPLQHEEQNTTNFLARSNFNYDFDEERNHSLNLNYNVNTNDRQTYDRILNYNTSGLPSRMTRHIVGLSWQNQWFNKRLVNNIAIKYYGLDTYKEVDERVFDTDQQLLSGAIVSYAKYLNFQGYSLASRYRIFKDGGAKFSAERAYNMPTMNALYGDGQNQIANWDLKPERSDNVNGGFYYNTFLNDNHFLNFDISGFYRLAKDYINTRIVTDNGQSKFQAYNIPGVKLYGADTEIRYGYKDVITATVNASYDKALDNKKYTDDTNQEVSLTYGYQIPNRPWIYGNLEIGLAQNDWLEKGSRTQLSWTTHYTYWYYLSDAHLGSLASKNHIPSQNVHSIMLSYSWHRNKYNVSGEVRNLTNERAYDNFRLQKPGRAFYVKLRVSLM
ncbi:TonB-dependent receptor [Sphingobacterium phlebotomi]|uniref:TonB-dependent receptor n=1 Tax=Sphingobacterium phlebotomi TaxID=2605433 RepID=A0A5D4H3W6_9SPHI|nr:TonB-dependent receptor plug domain-containing protein [Sphingobacterium phlebotomi]TYR34709.1 TonB-dependent receptor [Sphingobacterium phlebotomi]